MSWIDEILSQTTEIESPRQWIYWSSLAALSAVVSPNVYLDKFYYRLSPNLYIMLIGKSGLGKGWPVWMAKHLVTKLDETRVISGRNSIQAIVKELATAYTRQGKPMLTDSRGFLVSGEFADFIIQDPQALTILTDLYDTHYNTDWKNTLKGTGVESLKKVNLTMLGASSPIHFKDAVPENAIGGGFIGRTLLIYEEKRGHINSLTERPKESFDSEGLLGYLQEISKLSGPFTWEPAGKKLFDDWYYEFRSQDNEDKTGTDQRIHDHIIKVAMLLSLAEKPELTLGYRAINEAIDACLALSVNIKRAMVGYGKSVSAEAMGSVLKALLKAPGNELRRDKLLQKCWGEVDVLELERVEIHLLEAKAIIKRKEGSQIYYSLTAYYLTQLEEWKRGKGAVKSDSDESVGGKDKAGKKKK